MPAGSQSATVTISIGVDFAYKCTLINADCCFEAITKKNCGWSVICTTQIPTHMHAFYMFDKCEAYCAQYSVVIIQMHGIVCSYIWSPAKTEHNHFSNFSRLCCACNAH